MQVLLLKQSKCYVLNAHGEILMYISIAMTNKTLDNLRLEPLEGIIVCIVYLLKCEYTKMVSPLSQRSCYVFNLKLKVILKNNYFTLFTCEYINL